MAEELEIVDYTAACNLWLKDFNDPELLCKCWRVRTVKVQPSVYVFAFGNNGIKTCSTCYFNTHGDVHGCVHTDAVHKKNPLDILPKYIPTEFDFHRRRLIVALRLMKLELTEDEGLLLGTLFTSKEQLKENFLSESFSRAILNSREGEPIDMRTSTLSEIETFRLQDQLTARISRSRSLLVNSLIPRKLAHQISSLVANAELENKNLKAYWDSQEESAPLEDLPALSGVDPSEESSNVIKNV